MAMSMWIASFAFAVMFQVIHSSGECDHLVMAGVMCACVCVCVCRCIMVEASFNCCRLSGRGEASKQFWFVLTSSPLLRGYSCTAPVAEEGVVDESYGPSRNSPVARSRY